MTDHNHSHGAHGSHGGGHEIDQPPTRELFNIVWGLTALTLVSLVTCVQLFNTQARDIDSERNDAGSYLLAKYRKDMDHRTKNSGTEELTDATGKVTARYKFVPLKDAREKILARPEMLGAFPAPPGWVHPDDVNAGAGGAPPGAPTVPVGTPPSPLPPDPTPPTLPAGAVPVVPAPAAPAPAAPPAPAPAAPAPAAPAPVAPAPTPAPAK